MNGRVLISEEPLEVTPISWETRAIFRTVASPRKIVERLLSMPQSDSYSANLISADGSLNPISEAALRSLRHGWDSLFSFLCAWRRSCDNLGRT